MDGEFHTTGARDMSTSYVMKVSRNGQVSIPADARARWNADRVVVVDLGDRVVLRPLPDEPVKRLVGKYRGGASTEVARARSRSDDATTVKRKTR
jgi:AbrB family looped-hinge helix DNA binding protein